MVLSFPCVIKKNIQNQIQLKSTWYRKYKQVFKLTYKLLININYAKKH